MPAAVLVVAAIALLAACATGAGEAEGRGTGRVATTSVPTPDELAAALLSASEVGDVLGSWVPEDYFSDWPNEAPGVVPAEQQDSTKSLAMLAFVGCEDIEGAEDDVTWQAHTSYVPTNLPPGVRTVHLGENLLAGTPAEIEALFNGLRDAMSSCVGITPAPDDEYTTEQSIETFPVPREGDDQYGLSVHVTADLYGDGSYLETSDIHWALVRKGAVLLLILAAEAYEANEGASPMLTDDHLADIIATAVNKV